MRLVVPFFKQRDEFSCGPVVLRMLFAYFGRQEKTKTLLRELKTTPKTGTPRSELVRQARARGFRVETRTNASLRDIESFLKKEIPVIVNYREQRDQEGHYAIVVGTDGRDLLLHDPLEKPYFRMDKDVFFKQWYGYHKTKHQRWLMVCIPKTLKEAR